jgi:hypothetical protein
MEINILEQTEISPEKMQEAVAAVKATAEEKLRKKIMDLGREIWNRYQFNSPNLYMHQWDYVRMNQVARYFLGRQDQTQYLTKWEKSIQNKEKSPKGQGAGWEEDTRYQDLMSGNLKILNHVITALMGNMSRQKFTPTVFREDQQASDMRNDFRDKLYAAMQLKEFGIRYESLLNEVGFKEEELPVDDFDLRAKVEAKQFLDEAQMQMALKDTLLKNNFTPAILEKIRLHALLFGVVDVRVDWMSKLYKIRHTNPYFRTSGYSAKADCSDSPYDAELIFVYLDDLKVEAAGEIKDWKSVEAAATTYEEFYSRFNGMVLNRASWMERGRPAVVSAERGVAVLDYEYKRTEKITEQIRKTADGRVITKYGLNATGSSVVAERAIQYRYGAKLIVDCADEAYHVGRRLPRAAEYDGHKEEVQDLFTSMSGFITYRPMNLEGQNVAIGEKGLEYVQTIQQLWVKGAKIAKRILPPLVKIDRFGFNSLTTAPGQKGISGFDVAQSMVGDGLLIYDSQPYQKNFSMPKGVPVTIEHTEDTRKLREIYELIAINTNALREIMSTPPQATGQMPGTRTGQGVSELVLSEAQQSIQPWYDAVENVVNRMDKYILLMLKYGGAKGNYKGTPYNVDASTEGGLWKNVYCVHVKNTPTEARWERLYQWIDRFIDAGQMDPAVAFAIEKTDDLEEAQAMMIVMVKRMERKSELAGQYEFEQQNEMRKQAQIDRTAGQIEIDSNKQKVKTQGALIELEQKGSQDLTLQDKKTNDEITIMRMEEDQMDTIAKKVAALLTTSKSEK